MEIDLLTIDTCQLLSVLQEIPASPASNRIIGGGRIIGGDFYAKENSPFTCPETVLDRPDADPGLYPSDHFGVHAHLHIPD